MEIRTSGEPTVPVHVFGFLLGLSPQHQNVPHYGCDTSQLVIIVLLK